MNWDLIQLGAIVTDTKGDIRGRESYRAPSGLLGFTTIVSLAVLK